MNFKVGDKIVFQPQGNNIEDYLLSGVQEGILELSLILQKKMLLQI